MAGEKQFTLANGERITLDSRALSGVGTVHLLTHGTNSPVALGVTSSPMLADIVHDSLSQAIQIVVDAGYVGTEKDDDIILTHEVRSKSQPRLHRTVKVRRDGKLLCDCEWGAIRLANGYDMTVIGGGQEQPCRHMKDALEYSSIVATIILLVNEREKQR